MSLRRAPIAANPLRDRISPELARQLCSGSGGWGALRSEIKEEGAQPPGDIRGAEYPARPSL